VREPAPDFSTNQYERPNQPWVCGHAEHGHACPAGPTARGHCPALAECAPLRDGDRWVCNRSNLGGGPCGEGPTPEGGCGCVHTCHPVRSLRAKRGRFIQACAALAVGWMFISLSANWRDRAIRPGPLAQQHAQLLERADGAPNCGACHAAAAQKVAGWAMSLVITHDDQPAQSQLCMNCHATSISKEHALAAHNLSANALEQISRTTAAQQELRPSAPFQVACATCHREHHGAQFNLTTMDNAACQSCHQQRFASFASDHPDFGNWPYRRRTQIAFNHASHSSKYFAEKKQKFDCRTCHLHDTTGGVEQLASYETACASCHDEKITTSVGRGVPMLSLPTLDVDALAKAGHNIGAWPKAATGDFDGRLPPMMKLLLAADPLAAQALTILGPDFEFQDVDPDDSQQLAASANLATAIKSLIADISARGAAALRERLTGSLGRDVTEAEAAALMAGLSVDTLRGANSWVPGIMNSDNSALQASATVGLAKLDPPYGTAGSWSRDDAMVSIRYRPAAHADPVLASWLELLAKTPDLNSRPVAKAMFKELSTTTAPGLCASCHSVEQSEHGELAINWRAYDRTTEPRGFTKFSHEPHLTLPQLADCKSCHVIDDTANTTASYTDLNPQRFVSEFKPMAKGQCATCHTATAAGNSCQSCHNYHVVAVEGWRFSTPGKKLEDERQRLDSPFALPPYTKTSSGTPPGRR
jgi:predicted CXXCH cytochrome family protein